MQFLRLDEQGSLFIKCSVFYSQILDFFFFLSLELDFT